MSSFEKFTRHEREKKTIANVFLFLWFFFPRRCFFFFFFSFLVSDWSIFLHSQQRLMRCVHRSESDIFFFALDSNPTMLTSFASAASSSNSSPYENPPSWWKLNFSTGSYATFATAFLPSSSTTNTNEKRTITTEHLCELTKWVIYTQWRKYHSRFFFFSLSLHFDDVQPLPRMYETFILFIGVFAIRKNEEEKKTRKKENT